MPEEAAWVQHIPLRDAGRDHLGAAHVGGSIRFPSKHTLALRPRLPDGSTPPAGLLRATSPVGRSPAAVGAPRTPPAGMTQKRKCPEQAPSTALQLQSRWSLQGPQEPEARRSKDGTPLSLTLQDQDLHDQPKRRRIRKHKSKKKFKNPNSVLIEQAELEKQQSLLQEKSQQQHTDGTTISKNKKRKLKKKQQIKRKKAAGLAAKAAGVSFMYQPEDSSNEGEGVGEAGEEDGVDASEEDPTPAGEEDVKDTREEDGAEASEEDLTRARQEEGADASEEDPTPAGEEDVKDAREEDGADASEEDPTRATEEEGADASEEDPTPAGEEDVKDAREEDGADASEEDLTRATEEEGADSGEEDDADANEEDDTITNEKADSILNFLKSTQEMYFYDGVSRDAASAALADAAEELLDRLASHSMPPSDVSILYHMKTLLLLQDTERLKHALEMFPEHCTMPPDHARVISAFFSYWITHILPEKSSD
nr:glutamate-rich protein 1 isoform X2 [Pan paniscus]